MLSNHVRCGYIQRSTKHFTTKRNSIIYNVPHCAVQTAKHHRHDETKQIYNAFCKIERNWRRFFGKQKCSIWAKLLIVCFFFLVVLIHCSYFNAVKWKLPSISQVILANFCILFLFAIAPPTPNIFQKSVFFFCRITNMFRKLLTSDRSTWLSCRNNRIDEKPN